MESEEELAELREAVKVGLEQLERGEGAEWNVEEAKARLLQRMKDDAADRDSVR